MFAKLHLLSQDLPTGDSEHRWRAHPYLRMEGTVPKGPAVFDWSERQRKDLEALWRDPSAEGARERLARDLSTFCEKLGWVPQPQVLEDAEQHGEEYLLTVSPVPSELYALPWETLQVGASGTYLSDYASTLVRYAVPGLPARAPLEAPAHPSVLFAWSAAGGAVPHEEQAAAIREAARVGGVSFHELAEVDEARLQAALESQPPAVLHLLCHGLPGPGGEPPRLKWGASDNPSEITATRLSRLLRRFQGSVRMVVLSACGSGDGQLAPLAMSSLAQEVHRKGISNVVASRYPLSVRGSQVMTRALYDKLLREAWSLERALRHARQALLRVDEESRSYPGDAYGIQLYTHDTEKFVSDNAVEAERPVLASYPFGTAARPVPASTPPRKQVTLQLEGVLPAGGDVAGHLRRLTEDDSLRVEPDTLQGAALRVDTTVDGAQRLLGVWRSRALQTALGVIVGQVLVSKVILPALASDSLAPPDQAALARASTQAEKATVKQVAVTMSKAAATVSGNAGLLMAKLVLMAVLGGAMVVAGGGEFYREQRESSAPSPAARTSLAVASPPDANPWPVDVMFAGVAPPLLDAATTPDTSKTQGLAEGDAMPPWLPGTATASRQVPAHAPSEDVTAPDTAKAQGPAEKRAASPSARRKAISKDASPKEAGAPPANIIPPLASAPSEAAGPRPAVVKLARTLHTGASSSLIYRSDNFGEKGSHDTVGFVIPPQPDAMGPARIAWSGPRDPARIIVSARDKSTGAVKQLTFRGFRPNRCGKHPMNYAVGCQDSTDMNVFELSMFEDDNWAVAPGVYAGSVLVRAQGWHDKSFSEDLHLDFEVTIKKRDKSASRKNAVLNSSLGPVHDLLGPTIFVPSRRDDSPG